MNKIGKERVAITATLGDVELLRRVEVVVGAPIGDPLVYNRDSVVLREKFGLAVEVNYASAWAINDEVEAAVTIRVGSRQIRSEQDAGRRATVIAVASMYESIA